MDKMAMNKKQKLVISAVNLVEGGPLTVLRDCVAAAVELLGNDWDVIVLVNNISLIETSGVTLLEFPLAKRSWLIRLYYEWWHFRKLSTNIRPDIWLSIHDITAWVNAPRQAVYCHNPAPFYKITLREAWLEPTLLLFNLFYRYLYGIGIRRNTYVIVQQEWLRQEFKRLYTVRNVIVAHPVVHAEQNRTPGEKNSGEKFVFFYPALPRVFKNFELVCEAVKHLNQAGISGFEVRLTLDGSENRYAAYLIERYANTDGIKFIGRQNKTEMISQYDESDCVLFPSRLETWGLPITEAKALGKPLLITDLPYAHETMGTYDKVSFIDPFNAAGLANNMKSIMAGTFTFSGAVAASPKAPFVRDWRELLLLLTAHQ
jgi:glycosyltransferase involved in cell wall biosynthesis